MQSINEVSLLNGGRIDDNDDDDDDYNKGGIFFRKVKGHKLIKERERNANERLFRYRGDRLKVGEMIGE